MAKYHITKKGEAGVCRASYNCPLGGDDRHFATAKEASAAYEKEMTSELLPQGAQKDSLGLASLNKLARISSDREILENAVEKGSDRTLKALSSNENVEGDLLVAARAKASQEATVDALLQHRNYPVGAMSGEDFAKAHELLSSRQGSWAAARLMSNDHLNDAHIAALEANPKTDSRGNKMGFYSLEAVSNSGNQISPETRVRLAEAAGTSGIGAAQRSGLYPADRIEQLDEDKIYWGNVYNEKNTAYVDGYGKWALANSGEYKAQDIARHVASSEAASPEILDKLARAGFSSQDIYKNPNTSDSTKDFLAEQDPTAKSLRKLDKLRETKGENLINALRQDGSEGNTVYPSGRNRGYSITTVAFDPEKVKEAGLTSSDIYVLMNSRMYNAGARYDEATGVFTGAVDSTD